MEMKSAVEALSNVEEVEVTKDRWTDATGFDFYRWTVGGSRYIRRCSAVDAFVPIV